MNAIITSKSAGVISIEAIRSILKDEFLLNYDEKDYGMSMPTFHYHNVYEIYILRTGIRNLIINNQVYETKAYDAAMIKPYEFHRSYGDTKYSGICLNFSDSYLDRYFTLLSKNQLLSCFEHTIISLGESAFSEIHNLSEKITSNPKMKYLYLAEMLDIFNKYAQKEDNHEKLGKEENISPLCRYIQENFINIKSLDEVAKKFFITKNHLCYLFKKQTGMTVISYINSLRIQQACVHLSNPSYSIIDISFLCGFSSPIYFNKVFKSFMGCTPSEFRSKTYDF